VVAIIVVVALILGGGIFAVVALTGKKSSSTSPAAADAAVSNFFSALQSGDENKIADTLVERERSIIQNNIEDLRSYLRRLPKSPYKTMLGDVIEFHFDTVTTHVLRSENGATFLAVDSLKGAATSKANLLLETAAIDVEGTKVHTESDRKGPKDTTLKAPIEVVTLDEGNGPKVSLLYSGIENFYAQSQSGKTLNIAAAPKNGAPTPEAAVTALFTAAQTKDIIKVTDQLDPYEARVVSPALQPLLANGTGNPAVDQGLAAAQGVDLDFSGVSLKSESLPGNRSQVDISGTLKSTANGKSSPVNLDQAAQELQRRNFPGLFVVAVKDGSGWHVSLLETAARYGAIYAKNH
jgi:hypothetical protein